LTKQQKIHHYQCLSCNKVGSAEEWDKATFDDFARSNTFKETDLIQLISINEASWDGETWFTCPHCDEMSWDTTEEIIPMPDFAKTNKGAKSLLEKSW
jgi:hypothetical protein